MQRLVYVNVGIHAESREKYSSNEMDLKSLNQVLDRGWRVKQIVTPGEGHRRAFVLLEKDDVLQKTENAGQVS